MPELYTLVFTSAEVDQIGIALTELPMKVALPLWSKLKEQVAKQQILPPVPEEKAPTDGNHTSDNATS